MDMTSKGHSKKKNPKAGSKALRDSIWSSTPPKKETGNMDTSYSLISAVREGRLKRVRELISSFGLSYSQAWSGGYVLLRDAIENKHTAVTKLLLTSGSKVNSKSQKLSNTPLHFAVINGNIEIVEMLLDKGANIDAKNQYGRTPLHNAIENQNMKVTELLLKHGANVNARDNEGTRPLHVVVKRGCLQIVEHLLKHGAYVNCAYTSTRREGYTPLHIAAKNGSEEIVKFLLSSNAHINASAKDNLTPLYIATKNGHKKVVKLLLDHGANIDAQDKDGKAILHLAAEKGHSAITDHILKYCPDVDNKNNRSSLNAAVHGYGKEYSKIVESLLQYGFSVNPEDINICKLLHVAVEKGHLKIVEDLLKYGTDVNMLYNSTSESYTPLHNATKNKQEKIATLLINYGADVNAKDKVRKTPIFYAIENTDLQITKLLLTNGADIKDSPELLSTAVKKKCREIVEVLLQHDADINASDEYGRTALHFTVLRQCEWLYRFRTNEDPDINIKGEIAKLLLSRGANADARNKDGITTLHAAIQKGYAKVVEALLGYNANVNSVKNDITPLHLSAEKGNEVISTMLLNKGANVNAEQKDGITALHIATQKGHKEVVETLLKWGAKVDSKDKRDITPLHIAAQKGYLKIVKILLKFCADIDSRDEYGRTALHIASKEGHKEIVVALLEYVSDINIVSKDNHTPLDFAMAGIAVICNGIYNYDSDYDYCYYLDRGVCAWSKIAAILKQQIIKMKTANLYVSRKNLLSISSYDRLSDFQNECEEEMESMKSEKISNNVSFHAILTKNISQLAIYARNENIVQVLKSDDYKTKFPIYASMINSHFRKGVERKELLEQGNRFFHSLFNRLPELPYNCTEKIFSYLSDKDLRFLIDVCEHVNIPNTDIAM